MEYVEYVVVLGTASIVLAVSLDLLIGVAGLFSAAAGVFYGIGAYAAAIVWMHLTTNVLAALGIAFVVGCVAAIPFIVPGLRARLEVTFVVASLAFAAVVSEIFQSWTSVTGGNTGLVGVPIATLFGVSLDPGIRLVIVGVVVALAVIGIKEWVSRSTWGLDLRAVASDVRAARSLGVHAMRVRIQAGVLASGLAALAGVLYAAEVGYVDPSGFDINESELVAAMVVLGGLASLIGPVLGAIVLTAIPAALTFAPISPGSLGLIEQAAYGLLIVVIILLRPSGIAGGLTRVTTRLPRRAAGAPPAPAEPRQTPGVRA